MKLRIALFALILFCLSQAAHAHTSGFYLHFFFTPPIGATGILPTIFVDVCADPYCTQVKAVMQPRCAANSAGANTVVYFQDCAVLAELGARGPDTNLSLLSQAATLRLRMGPMMSRPFYFAGGAFGNPYLEYQFSVQQNGNMLEVTPH